MLTISGRGGSFCDGLTRRELLRVGGLGAFSLGLPQLLMKRAAGAEASKTGFGRAKACILLWMAGGPPQHETWDPKPDAPAEIRGPCKPIATSVPGFRVGEWMPRTAKIANRLCVLRGAYTNNPSHPGSSYELLTGTLHPLGKGRDDVVASRNDWPTLGAIVKRFKPSPAGIPAAVTMPQAIFNVPFYPGQDGGFLGPDWDPWLLTCDPSARDFKIPEFAREADVTLPRLSGRKALAGMMDQEFERLQRQAPLARFDRHTQQAFDLVAGDRARRAFDLTLEPPAMRDRYGWCKFGQSCLLARRLIEAGVGLVQVNWDRGPGEKEVMWDTHVDMADQLKNRLMPQMDQAFPVLLDDLDQRGLLDETLVVWMGEFGRTPKLEGTGRNHWGDVFSVALAGAGVRPGRVYGASDKDGGHPKDGPVGPADLTATIFHCLGIALDTEIRDRLGRPHAISRGKALEHLL